ncbi:putative Chase2 sensor protein [Desulforamulus reducens MI-1]|uniref:Putative Chase2 sensor protein n=1 Tax=Desulforamulus reducens (strain ATCC BAA-1160 / DSM 100696 / MI-1) TaxID=349161 RepID=A4J939_DESRM|nr:adenylate/guanylate cyclase domain-containing protein [Desulforamulus reducens]ABO51592.1 putative Chase2 sensor protein [Desulforamulus reducens MI-1]
MNFSQRLLQLGLKHKLLIPIILLIVIELAITMGIFSRPEMDIYDAWFRFKGRQNPGNQIVIVAIDESSINRIGPLAWPRSVHAELLERLREAKVVGFDMVFDSLSNPAEDQAFAEAIKKHGRVVLASTFSFMKDDTDQVEQRLLTPQQNFLSAGLAGLGFANTPTDPDQVVRRITLVDINTFDIPFPSFGLAVALVAEGIDPRNITLSKDHLLVGKKMIPIDSANRALANFWGPRETFKTIGYADVLEGRVPTSFFKDKIVLIGDTTAMGHDELSTPYTTTNMVLSGALPTPGVEIHASAVNSFILNGWFRQVPPYVNFIFLVLAGLTTSIMVSGGGPWKGLVGTLFLVTLSMGIVFALWQSHWWLNLAAPVTLIFLTYAVTTATEFLQAEMARRKTKAIFSRYLSPDVVNELIQNNDSLSLGGKRQDLTIMFCDIRGFTAYSEGKPPEEVVNRLNEYLTAITRVVFNHGGMLDKYLGDGLMAIFGAPIFYEDHIERAILAAVEIQEAIEMLNQKWAEQGAPPLNVGVGINSGSVLVGNVGSPERMDYTVIGEDVNLASRVEGLTKNFGALIVISERSVQQLPDTCGLKSSLRFLGQAEVKGFSHPVGVYTIEK